MFSEIVCGGPELSSEGNVGWAGWTGSGAGSGVGWAGILKVLPGTNSNAPALSLLMAILIGRVRIAHDGLDDQTRRCEIAHLDNAKLETLVL